MPSRGNPDLRVQLTLLVATLGFTSLACGGAASAPDADGEVDLCRGRTPCETTATTAISDGTIVELKTHDGELGRFQCTPRELWWLIGNDATQLATICPSASEAESFEWSGESGAVEWSWLQETSEGVAGSEGRLVVPELKLAESELVWSTTDAAVGLTSTGSSTEVGYRWYSPACPEGAGRADSQHRGQSIPIFSEDLLAAVKEGAEIGSCGLQLAQTAESAAPTSVRAALSSNGVLVVDIPPAQRGESSVLEVIVMEDSPLKWCGEPQKAATWHVMMDGSVERLGGRSKNPMFATSEEREGSTRLVVSLPSCSPLYPCEKFRPIGLRFFGGGPDQDATATSASPGAEGIQAVGIAATVTAFNRACEVRDGTLEVTADKARMGIPAPLELRR